MSITYREDLTNVDWDVLKADLADDHFDNGRSSAQLQRSFENSFAVCFAWQGTRIVGTARVLSDGICNAYLVDMWTHSSLRRQRIATNMMEKLCRRLSGQHLYLQVDADTAAFYRRAGFTEQPLGMSRTIGKWLVNEVR